MLEIKEILPRVAGKYRYNVDLCKSNWFNVGGKAKILFRPKNTEDLLKFLKEKEQDLATEIIGVGSNIIIKDEGFDGVIIKLGQDFSKINYENDIISIGASSLCYNAATYCKINGLSNLEFLVGIPGSIGGSIAMNAGCYGSEISDFLIGATIIDENNQLKYITNKDFNFSYRNNNLPKGCFILSGDFKVKKADSKLVSDNMANFVRKREKSQPIRSKTGGSTFKNPPGMKAWELIDKAGCRGLKVGGAQMSTKHCNFMINNGNATASDLINLGNEVICRVKEKTGITLKWEIRIIPS